MDRVLIVDIDPKRADLVCDLLSEHRIAAKRCRDFQEIQESIEDRMFPTVIFAHCALLNECFTELAALSHHSDVRLLFYCTEANQKGARTIAKLPEELGDVILRINRSSQRKKTKFDLI